MKAKNYTEVTKLIEIPNVGPATEKDFNLIGIYRPEELKNKDAIILFKKLCKNSGFEHDHCTADIFMAAISFMNGKKIKPWWEFSEERKGLL